MLNSLDANFSQTAAALAVGYVLGAIPFGLILTRLAGLGDVRQLGSGNIGATNVLRTGNKGLAALTLLLDLLKGFVAVLVGALFGPVAAALAGFAALIGHIFPVWLRFKGGKGVATYIGILLATHWPGVVVFAVAWLGTAALTRYSSAGALAATLAVPPALYLMGETTAFWLFLVLSVIVWLTHRANIRRLLAGTESRIGAKG